MPKKRRTHVRAAATDSDSGLIPWKEDVLLHADLGPMIWGDLGVEASHALWATCSAFRRRLREKLEAWRLMWDGCKHSSASCGRHKRSWMDMPSLVSNADLPLLEFAVLRGNRIDTASEELCWCAALAGRLEVLQWLRRQGCAWNERVCGAAAFGEHVHVLEWVRGLAAPCPWDCSTFARAAANGSTAMLQWLLDHGCPHDDEESVVLAAAACSHLDTLRWLHDHGMRCTEEVFCYSAQHGYLQSLEWMHRNGVPHGGFRAFTRAAAGGHLDVMQFLLDIDCPRTTRTFHEAVRNGHLRIVQWLVANDFPRNEERAFATAVFRGHADVVEWMLTTLHDANAVDSEFGAAACYCACERGFLETLRCLWRHSFPWNSGVCRTVAEENGHDAIVAWIDAIVQ